MAGIQLSATLEGFDDLKIRLAKSPDNVDLIETKMLQMAAMIVQAEAKQKAPVDKSTLRKSIIYNIEGTKGNRFAKVGTNVPYAIYQEMGTGIYGPKGSPITPKRAKMLVFTTKAGNLVFARSVRGSQPKKFMTGGLNKLIADMSKVLNYGKQLSASLLK